MEYNPLFEPGFHNISREEISELFVEYFDDSNYREYLVERLHVFLSMLEDTGIRLEIWIDGSFATEKPEPADIDIAIFYNVNDVNNLPDDKKSILMHLMQNPTATKLRYKCDVYFISRDNLGRRSYWRGWFGFDRDENPKGIPRLNM